ncbi:uncharacterized protein [Oryza sativa Japonica Group]|uniref:uncharacterized protein isoform X1 n=1 Tax=Oryza sativa subsp. japonica TaxID=39947 RepID=UPI000E1B8C85|nr:uncharacterized protein LOC107277958 isoform X2 [Oryza sativa Japonica Group]
MHLASAEFFLALIRPPTPPPVMTATEVDPSPLPPPSSSTPPSPSIGDRCSLLLPLGSLSPIRAARSPSPGVAWVCVAHQADLLSAVPISSSSSSASFSAATNLCRRNSISTKRLVPRLADLLSAARTMSPRFDLIHRKVKKNHLHGLINMLNLFTINISFIILASQALKAMYVLFRDDGTLKLPFLFLVLLDSQLTIWNMIL